MGLLPDWERPVPASLQCILDQLPATWVDDGLTLFPDKIGAWVISKCGTGHDAFYCTRMWPAGRMGVAHKAEGDRAIRDWVWAMLPFGLRVSGYVIFMGVWRGGYGSYNSCGPQPLSATDAQVEAGQCRHGVPMPGWMEGFVVR